MKNSKNFFVEKLELNKKNYMAKKKVKKSKRYGLVKVPTGAKVSLISAQNKHGWSLGLALSDRNIWFKNTRFASKQDVKNVAGKKVIFFPSK